MAINGVINNTISTSNNDDYATSAVATSVAAANLQTATPTTETDKTSDAVVYNKTTDAVQDTATKANKFLGKPADPATIERLKAEADERFAQLKGIVEKMLLKQGSAFDSSMSLADIYRNLAVDPATAEQAQKDIAEDGYWGVEQTSDRILDFAKALAGEDSELAKGMLDAIKEGFKQAEEAWGEKLPDISQKTLDASLKKVQDWVDSLESKKAEPVAESQADTAVKNQVK